MSDFELTGNLPKLAEINIKESNSFKNFKLNCSLPSLTKIDLEDSKRVTNLDCSIDSKEHPTPNLSVIYVGTNSSRNKIQSFGNFTKAPNLRYVSMPETNDIDYGFPSTVKLSN
jgi:hypothetical protein